MKLYNKLIRDKIPEIMEVDNKTFELRTLSKSEYCEQLIKKLHEEIREFEEADDCNQIEELADIVEVIYAIVENQSLSVEEFEKIRLAKKDKRGGFSKQLFLISVNND
ncbi:nucleoside triphosphate pyrophosphohydrolase [Paenibacillus sp. FSL R7-0333]|uniref:nucleoside triphosphate pyrophosphohydrolase n=1 Tax=Paenibacillus sp. FSL R7-0333 TaxID=1926587 RepID=UPI00096ECA59|nr:phosphoribosyl-ATP pyrophosphohydrolase [Paenibacillus sp. FSL R7-0333]